MTRRLLHPVAAVAAILVAAGAVAFPGAPASAAGCSTDHGVTVVVDFHQLGGGVQSGCVADGGGRTAAQLFPAAGFSLAYVQRQPGFVCRVSGKPADDPCVDTPPADAYWGLYWSDGESGRWTYATSGAGGQHVPDGGYVAFSWQGSSDSTPPGASPAPHPSSTPTPSPTPSSTHPTHTPATSPTTPAGSSPTPPAPTVSGSAPPTPTKAGHAPHSRRPAPSATSTTPAPTGTGSATSSPAPSLVPASSDPSDPGDGGLPGWVGPAVVVVLFGAAGGVAVVRRRKGTA